MKENTQKLVTIKSVSSKSEIKPKIRKARPDLLRRFRIAGYAVFFAWYFPKYAHSFIIRKFIHFKKRFGTRAQVEKELKEIIYMIRLNANNFCTRIQFTKSSKKIKNEGKFVLNTKKIKTNITLISEWFRGFLEEGALENHS